MARSTFGYGRMNVVEWEAFRKCFKHLQNVDAMMRRLPLPFPELNASSQQTDYLRYKKCVSIDDIERDLAQYEMDTAMILEIHERQGGFDE